MKYNLDFTRKWYGEYTPRTVQQFISWGINSTQLTTAICGIDTVILSDHEHPYTCFNEISNKYEIFFPTAMFSLKYYDLFNVPEKDKLLAAITLYNGFSIHESIHVKVFKEQLHTSDNITDLVKRFLSKKEGVTLTKFMICLNLVEDLYVWEYGESNYSQLQPFLEITMDIITDEKMLISNDTSVLQKLFIWRNTKARNNPIFDGLAPYVSILNKVVLHTNISERLALALELYNLLEENNDFSSKYEHDYLYRRDYGPAIFVIDNDKEKVLDHLKTEVASIEKAIDSVIENEKLVIGIGSDDSFQLDKVETEYRYIDSVDTPSSRSSRSDRKLHFEMTNKWVHLANYLVLKGRTKHAFGLPQKSGVELMPDEAYRLNTDEKIFGIRSLYKPRPVKPQVILLLDHSGSMGSLVYQVASETFCLASTLLAQGFKVSIYAHTTNRGSVNCLVYGIYSNAKPLGEYSLKKALTKLMKVGKRNNLDGLAIEYVSDKFLDNNQPKVLVVLSDGQPEGEHYWGDLAVKHTQQMINKSRRKGIKIFSVSLVNEVIETNNEIYGKEYNISGENIQSQLHKLANILN